MTSFEFQELLPTGKDETPYRLITTEHVSTFEAAGKTFLKVEPEGLTRLTRQAMHDIAHLLRPGHLAQLARILEDPEASPNDRFVALDLLKNANIAAGGVLPMCQDTGTAIVMGKKGQYVFTGGGDEAAIAAWRQTACHRDGQREGREAVFADYRSGLLEADDEEARSLFGELTVE